VGGGAAQRRACLRACSVATDSMPTCSMCWVMVVPHANGEAYELAAALLMWRRKRVSMQPPCKRQAWGSQSGFTSPRAMSCWAAARAAPGGPARPRKIFTQHQARSGCCAGFFPVQRSTWLHRCLIGGRFRVHAAP